MKFEHPEYISIDRTDHIKIIFQHTHAFLAPLDEGRSAIPEEFEVIVSLPTQSEDVLEAIDIPV